MNTSHHKLSKEQKYFLRQDELFLMESYVLSFLLAIFWLISSHLIVVMPIFIVLAISHLFIYHRYTYPENSFIQTLQHLPQDMYLALYVAKGVLTAAAVVLFFSFPGSIIPIIMLASIYLLSSLCYLAQAKNSNDKDSKMLGVKAFIYFSCISLGVIFNFVLSMTMMGWVFFQLPFTLLTFHAVYNFSHNFYYDIPNSTEDDGALPNNVTPTTTVTPTPLLQSSNSYPAIPTILDAATTAATP